MKINYIENANKEILKNIIAKNPEMYQNAIYIFKNKENFTNRMELLKQVTPYHYKKTKDIFESSIKSIKTDHLTDSEFITILQKIENCCKYFLNS